MEGEEEMKKDGVVVMECCDGMREEKEVEERGMKNGSDLTRLLRGDRECVAPAEVELGNAGWKEMRADGDLFEEEGEGGFEGFEMEGGGMEIDVGFEGLSLHEARKCDVAVGIETESNGNGNEKVDKERGPDCDAEKNEGGERDEICEKNDGPIEMKNSLHEMRERTVKLELYAESSGDLKEKREEVVVPDCNSEKIDGEKWYEICEKEERGNEIENGIERGSTEPSELNSENGRSKEKIEDGPACTFQKQTGEKDVKNETVREYAEKVELHIEDKEKSKEKAPSCNSEKQGNEKGNEILEKKEGEKDMKKQMDLEVSAKVKLNTEENGDMNGKIDQGPDCHFRKTDAEKRYEIYEKKNGQGKDGENEKKEGLKLKYVVSYPQRTGRPDCPHYLKNRFCSYGDKCSFNHPPSIANQVSLKSSNDSEETLELEKTKNEIQLRPEWLEKGRILIKKKLNCEIEKKEGAKVKYTLPYPQRKGRSDCDSYLKTGVCFYASKCLYNHPNQGNDNTYEVEKVNNSTQNLGLPIRPGEINCAFYMKHGSCKYSTNCRYNHPNRFRTKLNPLNYEEHQNNHYIENNDPLNYQEPNQRKQNPSSYEEYQNNGYLEHNDPLKFEEPNHFITKQNPLEEYQNNFEENNDPFTYEDSSSNELLPINIKKMVLPKYEGDIPLNIKAMLLPPQRLHDNEQVSVSISSTETFEGNLMNSSKSKSDSNLSKKSNPTEKSKSTPKSNSSYQMEGPFEFPQRPGKEECAFYMKCGHCMFKSSCKFHHPKDWHLRKHYGSSINGVHQKKTRLYDAIETQERLIGVLRKGSKEHRFPSEAYNEENWKNGNKMKQKKREEYPERPDKPLCEYYMKHRDCKFKFTCKFHHPKNPYQQGWN